MYREELLLIRRKLWPRKTHRAQCDVLKTLLKYRKGINTNQGRIQDFRRARREGCPPCGLVGRKTKFCQTFENSMKTTEGLPHFLDSPIEMQYSFKRLLFKCEIYFLLRSTQFELQRYYFQLFAVYKLHLKVLQWNELI